MSDLRVVVRESMFVLDGGLDAELPTGSGGPVLAGPEAVFIAAEWQLMPRRWFKSAGRGGREL